MHFIYFAILHLCTSFFDNNRFFLCFFVLLFCNPIGSITKRKLRRKSKENTTAIQYRAAENEKIAKSYTMAENKSGRKGELFNEKLITPFVLVFVPIGSFESFNRSNYLLRWTKLIECQKKNEKSKKKRFSLASFE